MESSSKQIDKLILVVHGVGDPSPGETLDCFTRAFAEGGEPLLAAHESIWLREKGGDPNRVESFPVPVRMLQMHGSRLQLAEVFWGDLSRVRQGIFGILYGLFQIVFGLRYVAYVAADQPGPAAFRLKQLGLISSRILQGPVLAVTFFLTLLTIAVYASQVMWFGSYKGLLWTQIVIAACCLTAMAAAAIGWRITRSRVVRRFWFWVSATNLFVTGLMIIKTVWVDRWFPEQADYASLFPGLVWYCRVLVLLLGLLWLVEMIVLLGMALCWAAAMLDSRIYRPAIHIAFLLPAAAIGLWSQLLPAAWLTAREGLNRIVELPEYLGIFDELIPVLGVQLLMALSLLLVNVWVVVRYFRWRRRHVGLDVRPGIDDSDSPPRLIVHPAMQTSLGLAMVSGILLTMTVGFWQWMGHPYQQTAIGRTLAEMNKYAVVILVPLSSFLALLAPHLRPAFDIVLDVVNHFYFRSTRMSDVLDDDDEFDISETTFQNGRLFFSRRDRIHFRIKRILGYFRDRLTNRPELIVVAHSQGTMIAIEVLNDPELSWLQNAFRKTTLVTMGSPLGHLYQHYFRHIYPPLSHREWEPLRNQVDQWVNVCRADDFVGTTIDFPGPATLERPVRFESSPDTPERFVNWRIGARGHQGYWCDREALQIIHQTVFPEAPAGRESARAA